MGHPGPLPRDGDLQVRLSCFRKKCLQIKPALPCANRSYKPLLQGIFDTLQQGLHHGFILVKMW